MKMNKNYLKIFIYFITNDDNLKVEQSIFKHFKNQEDMICLTLRQKM